MDARRRFAFSAECRQAARSAEAHSAHLNRNSLAASRGRFDDRRHDQSLLRSRFRPRGTAAPVGSRRHPIRKVRFVILSEDAAGKITAQSMTHQEFVDMSEASMGGKAFYEHEVHRITQRAGNVVHVFSTAERSSSPDGKVEGRGIDSIELFWDGKRWWITGANLWDLNTTKHPLPPEFLP